MNQVVVTGLKMFIMSIAICGAFLFAGNAQAVPITGVTGVEINDSFNAPSTNALNYAQQTPGHLGQATPFVTLLSNGVGTVTLQFTNAFTGGAFFEYRIDKNIITSGTPHLTVPNDFEYSGVWIPTPLDSTTQTFNANDMVEVRLALGGERDWDFDWTSFSAVPAPVPEPGTMMLLGAGFLGLAVYGKRRKKV